MRAAEVVGARGSVHTALGDLFALPHIAVADGDGVGVLGAVVHSQNQSLVVVAAGGVDGVKLENSALGVDHAVPLVAVANSHGVDTLGAIINS